MLYNIINRLAIERKKDITDEYICRKPIESKKLSDCDNILKRKPKFKSDQGWYDWERQNERES
jgi:hypothetical protein